MAGHERERSVKKMNFSVGGDGDSFSLHVLVYLCWNGDNCFYELYFIYLGTGTNFLQGFLINYYLLF